MNDWYKNNTNAINNSCAKISIKIINVCVALLYLGNINIPILLTIIVPKTHNVIMINIEIQSNSGMVKFSSLYVFSGNI